MRNDDEKSVDDSRLAQCAMSPAEPLGAGLAGLPAVPPGGLVLFPLATWEASQKELAKIREERTTLDELCTRGEQAAARAARGICQLLELVVRSYLASRGLNTAGVVATAVSRKRSARLADVEVRITLTTGDDADTVCSLVPSLDGGDPHILVTVPDGGIPWPNDSVFSLVRLLDISRMLDGVADLAGEYIMFRGKTARAAMDAALSREARMPDYKPEGVPNFMRVPKRGPRKAAAKKAAPKKASRRGRRPKADKT